MVPVAEGAVAGADGQRDVTSDPVADELRVHRPRHVVRHRDDAPQIVGRRLHSPADLPQEDQQEAVHEDERHGRDRGAQGRGQSIPARQELAGDDRPESDDAADDQDAADRPAAEERQNEDDREQRGDRHGERELGFEDGRHRDEDEGDGGDSADRLGLSQVAEPQRDPSQPGRVGDGAQSEDHRSQLAEGQPEQRFEAADHGSGDGHRTDESGKLTRSRVGLGLDEIAVAGDGAVGVS